MSKEVKIDAKLNGAEAVEAGLKSIGETGQQVGEKFKNSNPPIEETGRKLKVVGETTDKAADSFMKVQASLEVAKAAFSAYAEIIEKVNAALERNMELSAKMSKDVSALQHMLGDFSPEMKMQLRDYALHGERNLDETANAWYNLRSSAGNFTIDRQDDLFKEALEFGKTEPMTPIDQIVSAFMLYAQKTGETDNNKIQNVLKTTLSQANTTMAGVADQFPRFLPAAMTAGLSGPDAAALWSTATKALGSPNVATTGLQASFLGLEGRGTPEGRKVLERAGIGEGDDFFTKLSKLSGADISPADLETMAGREGFAVLDLLIKQPDILSANLLQTRSVAANPRLDIIAKELWQKNQQDPYARMESMRKQAEIRKEFAQETDLDAAQLNASEEMYRAAALENGELGIAADAKITANRLVRNIPNVGGWKDIPIPALITGFQSTNDIFQIDELIPRDKQGPTSGVIINGNIYNAPNPAPAPVVGPDAAQ